MKPWTAAWLSPKRIDIVNPYDVLLVKPDASRAEIDEAYRDLVKVWHPDRFARIVAAARTLRSIERGNQLQLGIAKRAGHDPLSHAPRRAMNANSETLIHW